MIPRTGRYRQFRSISGIVRFTAVATVVLLLPLSVTPSAHAAKSWFSKVRVVDSSTGNEMKAMSKPGAAMPTDSALEVFDVVISLYNDPAGDNDPSKDSGSEDQAAYENIIRHWADAVYEQSNGAHRLGKVRIFRNGGQSDKADVVWNASEWPCANPSGFGTAGLRIMFGDVFPGGCGTGCDYSMLENPEGAGYTLGHEWGHYAYGLYDEYRGTAATSTAVNSPLLGDTPVSPSVMHSQWNAVSGNFDWLNYSTSNNYQPNTAQGRVYGASAWDVLIRRPGEDPRTGARSALPLRTRYTALAGHQPGSEDGWIKKELPGARNVARDQLDIVWMDDDLEMQVVIDRSGSMWGSAIDNAKQAASILVDVAKDGSTALGIVSFAHDVAQNKDITAIPLKGGDAVKTDIKSVISGITASGATALFDGADLALTNLQAYHTVNKTSANRVVFLLSDGEDNSSAADEPGVISRYQKSDVPMITFGYGAYAPTGVLSRLADNTGGKFFTSPTTLSEIQRAFLEANTAVSDTVSVASSTVGISSGTTGVGFQVDETLDSFTVIVTYKGAVDNVALSLAGPAGPVKNAVFNCTQVGEEVSCTVNVDAETVKAQGYGAWSVAAVNNSGGEITATLDIVASPSDGRTFDVSVDTIGGSEISYPDPVAITATVSRGLPVTGVSLSAVLTDPEGNKITIPMNDEGKEGDAVAGDGIYSVIADYTLDGSYTVKVWVNNDDGEARYTDAGFQPAASPDINGHEAARPELPVIESNFTRTATTQFTVKGVMSDDHSDLMPGTVIYADNTDVAGKIDFAGDIDIFQISGIDTSKDLIVRVANFALGMEPRLTVYSPDGKTAVGTCDLANASSRGYIFMKIPSGKLDCSGKMIAKIQHIDSKASQGNYEISAGKAIDIEKVRINGILDLNNDGTTDLLIKGPQGTVLAAVVENGKITSSTPVGNVNAIGAGDFNGDGITDLLVKNANGSFSIGFVRNGNIVSTVSLGSAQPAGTGDFNGDGTADVLVKNSANSYSIAFIKDGVVTRNASLGNIQPVGLGDFNGDGTADVLVKNTSGSTSIAFVANGRIVDTSVLGTLQPVGTGDFNGDGTADLLVKTAEGKYGISFMNKGRIIDTASLGSVQPVDVGDYNGDGTADLLVKNSTSTSGIVFLEKGTVVRSVNLGDIQPVKVAAFFGN